MGAAIVYGIKIAITVATAVAFFTGITTLLTLVTQLAVPTVFGEIIGIISIYLPFDPGVCFGILGVIAGIIFTFLATRKVYQLMSTIQRDA